MSKGRMMRLVSILIAIGVGLLILSKKVGAAPASPPAPSASAAPSAVAKDAKAAAPKDAKDAKAAARNDANEGASGTAPKGDAKDATSTSKDEKSSADADGGAGDPLDYAVIQDESDFPKDMSEEEKAVMGTGKVPIHREGPFRSPFAHPRFGGPAHAKVGLVIREIRDFNIQTGGFDGDFFLSLTSDKAMPKLELAFTNGHDVTVSPLVDTPTFKLLSVTGSFTTDIDLRQYPFDEQKLDIAIEDQKAGVDQIVFEPDQARTSLDSSFKLASFGVSSVGAIAYKHKYPPRFDRDDLYVSRYRFTLGVGRFATSAAFSVFVPAFIIVLISLTGMWVPPDELEVRSNAGAPMLAAAVLFHYSLIQSLPATGYLTHADKLMLGVYVSLMLNMLSTWLFMLGEEEWVAAVFRWARILVPVITLFVMVAACIV
ncbi:MAG: hypothetical protein U0169_18415 [Polyangiaceae bacterium]